MVDRGEAVRTSDGSTLVRIRGSCPACAADGVLLGGCTRPGKSGCEGRAESDPMGGRVTCDCI